MVICFDCDAKTKAVLDDLLASDQFRDYSEVISTAIRNLAILRARVPKRGSTVIGDSEVGSPNGTVTSSGSADVDLELLSSTPAAVAGHKRRETSSWPEIPALFRLDHIPSDPPVFGKVTAERWERETKIPLAKWIFGQYNKLLPAKVTCRALAHVLAGKPNGVALKKTAATISEEAAVLGDFLAAHDSKHGFRRDEALQTGFPRTTVSGGVRVTNSGQLRYANQFVGGEVGKTEVSGLPIALKLIRCEGPERLIQLTEPGWRFALLDNPVLDGGKRRAPEKFSKQETELLLDHIALNVPVELFAYRTLLTSISAGANTPDKLNASLQEMDIWWQDRKSKDTVSFLNTQRSGAISRMADLELLQRDRQGTRVTYRLTHAGEDFLKQAKSAKR